MAINSFHLCDDKTVKSVYSASSKESCVTQCHLVKINFAKNGAVSSANNKTKSKNKFPSPYLANDRVQLLSRLTEKKLYKQTEFVSSFPLAAKLYRANSDEFRLKKRRGKKNKKSVLTLPNGPSVLPQSCTVSDMNDSEYFNSEKKSKPKRLPMQNKKIHRRDKNFEFYDRDAKYCSQVNIDLDCSSTDIIKNIKGDCNKKSPNGFYDMKMKNDDEVQPHDVWAVLRNINRFQFNPSPPISEDSIVMSPRKKKAVKKNKRKTASVIETCRTERYAYISSIDVGSKSPSPTSSIDRITVIGKEDGIDDICVTKQKKLAKIKSSVKSRNKGEKTVKDKARSKKIHKDHLKPICSPVVDVLENTPNNEAKGYCKSTKGSDNNDSLILSSVGKSQASTECGKDKARSKKMHKDRLKPICSPVVDVLENDANNEAKEYCKFTKGSDNNDSLILRSVGKYQASTQCVKDKTRSKKMHKDRFKPICSPVVDVLENGPNNEAKGYCKFTKGSDNNDSLILSSVGKFQASTECVESYSKDDVILKDSLCHITTEIDFTHSSHSGSNYSNFYRKDKDKRSRSPVLQSHPKMCGPTKIALSKGQELTLSKRQESSMRKPRLVTTMPSSAPVPKLTKTDIRRRLANIKFPIDILGKDQLSATIEVEQYDHPQFNGLDEHVWPFMLAWTDNGKDLLNPKIQEAKNNSKKRNNILDRNFLNTNKPINYSALNKQAFKANKITAADISPSSPKKKDPKQILANQVICTESQQVFKSKPIRQFRDKMLKLIYKKASNQSIIKVDPQICDKRNVKEVKATLENESDNAQNVNVEKTINSHLKPVGDKENICCKQTPTAPSNLLIPSKHRWGKAKWASAFIENVIKKIKNGSYYTHDISEIDPRQHNDSKEVSIQTAIPLNGIGINMIEGREDFTPKITIQKKKEALGFLPGFDDDVPQLEIKSMTRNQIAVKHCVTNVILQFDVSIPLEPDQAVANLKRSTSCIPLTITESKTKVFKCKARIVNAILPAEICSIIPKLMSKLGNPEVKLALPSVQEANVDTCLSTISEWSTTDTLDTLKPPLMPHIEMSLGLMTLVDGEFPKISKPTVEKSGVTDKNSIHSMIEIELPLVLELLPRPSINHQYYLQTHPSSPLTLKAAKLIPKVMYTPNIEIVAPEPSNLCTDLVPYILNETNVSSSPLLWNQCVTQCILSKLFNFAQRGISNSILNYNSVHIPSIKLKTQSSNIIVNLKFGKTQEINSMVSIDMTKFKLDLFYDALTNISPIESRIDQAGSNVKCIQYIKNVDKTKIQKTVRESSVPSVSICKHKRRRFVKLYKKCKSTSHISAEKSSTLLSKITNLDDFFQALGTGKPLSSAFDGYCGRKILASIIEMKSWITEITPRQALLILLLTNKKDTPNLVRFRPVILQGIAVNRITRATELDMEIEVIERESFNKFSEHDGIPYVPSCMENDDNLLEELYWIAKTTASDYQRPFDESSEKLLKALLEKRKKLNPSYLRVMARYVGLGLLKSPAKS